MISSQELLRRAQEISPYLIELRRTLHQNPELGGQEYGTQALVLRELERMGIEAKKCAGTGVVGLIRGGAPGRTIALRADMDALPLQEETGLPFSSENPGVMHACGHDTHTAALLGAARLLQEARDQLKGNVKLLFQPDEEYDGGAQRMVAEGCLEEPHVDAVFGGHSAVDDAAGQFSLKFGQEYAASNPFTITVYGRGTHGASPSLGIDAVLIGSQIVCTLQSLVSRRVSPTDSAVVTVGSFHAGTGNNIIAETARLGGILRTLGPEMRKELCALVRQTAEGVAAAMGGRAEVNIVESYPGVVNEDRMSRLAYGAMVKLVGEENARIRSVPEMGTEDMGYFMEGRPGCYCYFGFGDGEKECTFPAHNPHFRVNEDGLAYAAALHAQVALDYLEQQEF